MISCVLRELEKLIVYFSTTQMWCTSHTETGLSSLTKDSRRKRIAGALESEDAHDLRPPRIPGEAAEPYFQVGRAPHLGS